MYGVCVFTETCLHRAEEGVALRVLIECEFIEGVGKANRAVGREIRFRAFIFEDKNGITFFSSFGGDSRCPHNYKRFVDRFLVFVR